MFLSFKPIYMSKIKVRYLSINEILTIKEYWNLIGREQFLVITWQPDFSRACSFHRMLMNHKNFRFTQIPDKTNDMVFLKSPKTIIDHFWSFLPNRDFFKKTWLCHTQLTGLTDGPFQPRLGVQKKQKRGKTLTLSCNYKKLLLQTSIRNVFFRKLFFSGNYKNWVIF